MASFWLYTFPKSQLFTTIPEPTSSFKNQTVIVTGANSGLGFEAALRIARLGAGKLILACRTVAKGEATAAKILASIDRDISKDSIEAWELNVSSYKSIKAFVDKAQSLERLDAVIQNAGIMNMAFEILEESGEESVLTTNVTGPIFFGLSLLPKLRQSAKSTGSRGRLTFVGSDTHYIAKFAEADTGRPLYEVLNDPRASDMSDRYPTSKLVLLSAIREIAARSPVSEGSNVIITCQTPGFCYSDLQRNTPAATKIFIAGIQAIFARSTEIGGRTLVQAVEPDLDVEAHGRFLMDCKIVANIPRLDSEAGHALQRRFTDELLLKLENIKPGVTACLTAESTQASREHRSLQGGP